MRGLPEDVARALIVGIVRNALPARRSVVALATRSSLRSFTMEPTIGTTDEDTVSGPVEAGSPARIEERAIRNLVRFLESHASGGADVSPALDEAFRRIDTEHGVVNDIVIVSDMRFPRIGPTQRVRLDELQRRGTVHAHAVTIGESPMSDPLNTFDYRWHIPTRRDVFPGR